MKQPITIISLGILVPIGIVILFSLHIVAVTRGFIYTDNSVPTTHTALILGAAILKNGELSPVLRDRADRAIELYKAGKVVAIIASGNNISPDYNEVAPMKTYLVKGGIPEKDITTDSAGVDTYSSVYRAQHVFDATSLIIVSQSFHLPRAVYIARKLGIEAYGVSADNGHYKLTNYFREMLADSKAIFNLVFKRTPQSPTPNTPSVSDWQTVPW